MIVAGDEPRNFVGRERRVLYLKALASGHGREEVVTLEQLAQPVERGQLAGLGATRSRETLLQLLARTDEVDEHHAAAVRLHEAAAPLDQRQVLRVRVDEGEDERDAFARRLLNDRRANRSDHSAEGRRAEVEDRRDAADADVVVEETVSGLARQLTRHRQLTDARRAVDEDEVHTRSEERRVGKEC